MPPIFFQGIFFIFYWCFDQFFVIFYSALHKRWLDSSFVMTMLVVMDQYLAHPEIETKYVRKPNDDTY